MTAAAAELLESLRERHGPLMFHQSGGCCDGSSPMCYPRGDFVVGDRDPRRRRALRRHALCLLGHQKKPIAFAE